MYHVRSIAKVRVVTCVICLSHFLFWLPGVLSSPCGEIASAFDIWKVKNGHGDFDGIPGSLAHDCLRSMPLRPDLALRFLGEYTGYLQFQSTIVSLEHAPSSYPSPTIDLRRGLDRIRENIINGLFSSQFEFDMALNRVISKANDGHLQVGLCSQEIFKFQYGVALVSISDDGIDLPRLYVYSDAVYKYQGGDGEVSPIVEINGVEANYYLQSHIAVNLAYQDSDARYNALFPSLAAGSTGTHPNGAFSSNLGRWPGESKLTVRFANGTRLGVEATAAWRVRNGPMKFIDGQELFKAACLPSTNAKYIFGSLSSPIVGSRASHPPSVGSSAYPEPEMVDPDGLARGYYLDSASMPDTCVLQISNFHLTGKSSRGISDTIRRFLEQASSDGKTKLILDFCGNEGGDVIPGFNLFRTLFPDQPIYSATRFRSTEIVKVLSHIFSLTSPSADSEPVLDPPLAFQSAVGPDQEKHAFDSWESLVGPDQTIQSDNMSRAYAVIDLDAASTSRDPISGYGSVPLAPRFRMFSPENILIVTDGRCSSTCAIMVGLLQTQGVRTLAFGGRPRKGRMQAVGGVKGGQRWSLRTISRHIRTARELLDKEYAVSVARNNTERLHVVQNLIQRLETLSPPALPLVTSDKDDYLEWQFALRFDRHGQSSVNFRDAYMPGSEDTPWQFVYEAADCRLFLRLENIMEPASRWVSAANAVFGRGTVPGKCVE